MRILEILEMVEWKWTITEILDQPDAILNAVVSLKSTGLKMRAQIDEQKKGKL